MKRLFIILLCSVAAIQISFAANREYKLTLTNISNVDFKTTYSTSLYYEQQGVVGSIPTLLSNGECQFENYQDSNHYVESVTADESTFYIKFKRHDTLNQIDGTVTITFLARSSDESTAKRRYWLTVNYTYGKWSVVDGGEIVGPIGNYDIGEYPGRISSVYSAIPLADSISYSWEKSINLSSWEAIDNVTSDYLYPDRMEETSVYYRRKAKDNKDNFSYSNIVEIFAMFNAGEIGIAYEDSGTTLTLTNIKSPNSQGANISWQSSTDLESWEDIGGSSYSRTIEKPSVLTYYRRVLTSQVEDNDGDPISRYSNIVCYSEGQPVYYVQTQTYRTSNTTITDNTYYDGLGRAVQTINVDASPDGNDIVATTGYDSNGRETAQVLPFNYNSNGKFVHNAGYKSNAFNNDNYSSSVTKFESSPLNRVSRSYKPGEIYQSENSQHYVEYSYDVNTENEVKCLSLNSDSTIVVSGNHPANTLRKTAVTNEDGVKLITFVNSEGKTILERRLVDTDNYADTYFVYDVKNLLRWVISPVGSDSLADNSTYVKTGDFAANYCYTYTYDNDNRITERRIPGCAPSTYSYDTVGRLSSFSDGKLSSLSVKQIYTYDALDRICEVSYKPNDESSSEQYMQHSSHYDDYSSVPSALAFEGVDAVVTENDKATSVKGKLAYEQIFEVYDAENTSAPKVLSRAYYYDKRDRIIQTVTQYPEGIFCRTSVKYDYVGNPLATVEHYNYADDSTLTIRTDRTFDDRSRQLTEQTSINGEVVSNAAFSYDELGRMKCLELGDNVSINTSYNLQGWISAIEGSKSATFGSGITFDENLFDEQLKYYNPTDTTSTPYYSGKISEQIWNHGATFDTRQGFQYNYDNMGRLTNAQTLSFFGQILRPINDFSEQVTYDKSSNIVQLKNTGGTISSSATRNYSLVGNKISNVAVNNADKGACLYDSRGNMTKNTEAGLQFSYNLCNLPKQVTAEDGTLVKYSYFADGTKFKVVDAADNGFVYTGSLRWSVQNGVLIPESVAVTGGRALYDDIDESWSANYFICDHLGSVRVVTDAEGNKLDTYDYMPYGRELIADTDNITDYRFTGKEKQTAFGESNIYDSFARFQNTTGRFMSIDPKAEEFYHISPYTYCAGDPVNLVDPDGEKFTETLEVNVSTLEDEIRNKINNYEEIIHKLKPKSRRAKKYNGYIADLKQALVEYQVLRESTQLYDIVFDPPLKQRIKTMYPSYDFYAITTYDVVKKVYNINVLIEEDLQLTLIHELKHAYQFDIGASSFKNGGWKPGEYADYNDEVEAFARQASFMHNDDYGIVPYIYNEANEILKNKGKVKYPYNGTDVVHPKFRAN